MSKKRINKAYLNPDRPLDLEIDSDRLSFKRIADTISQIIKKPQRPYTFGLFGKWGTGKSTILKYVEKSFDNDENYAVVSFDAWKYEGDALRRSFLVDISSQLETKKILKGGYTKELEEDTYTDKSQEKKVGPKTIKEITIYVFLTLIAIAIQILLVWLSDDNPWVTNSTSIVFITALVGYLVFVLNPTNISSLFVKNINITKDKLSSPEEFYSRFTDILNNLSNKTLIVIIDNLDRTQKEATVKLLGTIKTFLNSDQGNEDVIFIIASDQNAIKRHIKNVYSNGTNDDKDAYESEEFLKKFFNAIIELPPYISSEYIDYINDLIDKTQLDYVLNNKDDIVRIIELAYPDNPRGAKQFVNNLVVFLLMIDEIGTNSGVDQDFIKVNLNFITAMLVFRDKFAEVYDIIRDASLNNEQTWDEIKEKLRNAYHSTEEGFRHPKVKDFNHFYEFTESWARPENDSIRWFFTMRRSKEEVDLPNWDPFIRSLDKNDHETARKYLGEFFTKANEGSVKLIASELNTLANHLTRWNTFVIAFLFVYINSVDDFKKSIQKILKLVFKNFPVEKELAKISNLLNINEMLNVIYDNNNLTKQEINRVKGSIIGFVSQRDASGFAKLSKEQVLQITSHLLSTTNKDTKLAKAITDASYSAKEIHQDVIDSIATVNSNYPNVISLDYATKVSNTLPNFDNSKPESTVSSLDFVISAGYKNAEITQKIYELITVLQNAGDTVTRPRIIGVIYEYLKDLENITESLDIQSVNNITSYIQTWYSNDGDFNNRKKFIPILLLLTNEPNNSYLAQAISNINNFIESAPESILIETLASLDPEEFGAREKILPGLKNRLITAPSAYTNNELEANKWITSDGLADYLVSVLDNLSSLSDYQKFDEGVELSFRLKDQIEEGLFLDKLMTAMESSVDKFTESVSTYVYKRTDSPLKASPDRLKELKRRIQEIKNPKS